MTENLDVITLTGLSAVGHHGVFDFERNGSQVFTADISLHLDTRKAAATDDVQYTVDYSVISNRAIEILSGTPVCLIETLAERLADMALQSPLVKSVDVTVHKPMAPVGHVITDVALTIHRDRDAQRVAALEKAPVEDAAEVEVPAESGPTPAEIPVLSVDADEPESDEAGEEKTAREVILGLGSNLGDGPRILSTAVAALMEVWGLEIDDVSPLVTSRPVLAPGQAPQPNYVNAVVSAHTVLSPHELLAATSSIEDQLGRKRGEKWAARTADIDIITVEGVELADPDLQLPHPRAHERAFVLYPWYMLDQDAVLTPGGPVAELLENAPDQDGILDVVEDWLVEPGQVDVEEKDTYGSGRTDTDATKGASPAGRSPAPAEPTDADAEDVPSDTGQVQVTIRGNEVRLSSLGGDAVFQRLLDAELVARREGASAAADKPSSAALKKSAPQSRKVPGAGTPGLKSAKPTKSANPPTQAKAPEPAQAAESTVASKPVPAATPEPPKASVPANFGRSTPSGSAFPTSPPSAPTPVSAESASDVSTPATISPRRARDTQRPQPAGQPVALPDWRFATEPQSVRIVDTAAPANEDPAEASGGNHRRVVRPTPTGLHVVPPPAADR